jgi:predicted nucleic acid-binding protein
MPKVRKIDRVPENGKNYFLIDANFLANKFLPIRIVPNGTETERIKSCLLWWREIEAQIKQGRARVFVPDICIAEAFKVLAKRYYVRKAKWFKSFQQYSQARGRLSNKVRLDYKALKTTGRKVAYHDISTNRDIIISVDRFFEPFCKNEANVQISDFILAATAKYLMEFYDLPKDHLHIITLDHRLRKVIERVAELPNAYDPTIKSNRAPLVFAGH